MKAFLAIGLLAGAILPLAAADATDRTVRTIPLQADTAISLDATIASLSITGSDRQDAAVEIVRHAPSSADLGRYPVTIDAGAAGVHIAAIQDGEGRDPALKSDITLLVPAAARLTSIRVFEGRVKLANLRGACDVDLQRGPIDATRLGGRVRLEAGIGSIDVRDAQLTPGGMMRLRVFNGPLTVRFAQRPANGRLLALTFNGRLTSDIPLTLKDKFGPRFGETTLGTGDPVMSLDVVKGDISIKLDK
ncbi:MAG TPA: hypothetical protein VL309_03130 [Vicinamibacterales bacterium]|jgi:hypothetical protein|nr:hypothetical protein [Vicinamibacterales bacterium]